MNWIDFLRRLFDRRRPTPAPTPAPPSVPGLAPGLVVEVNRARAAHGRPLLVEEPRLTSLARSWARAMAFHDSLNHGDFGNRINSVFPNVSASENIAAGQQTADEVVADWLTSPGHRANLLGDFNILGVGSARSAAGLPYWCADFVRTSAR